MISAAMNSPLLKEPPDVRGYPIIGIIPHLNEDALSFMSKMRDQHGDVVRTHVGNRTAVLISDPAMIEHVLVTNPRNYSKQTRGYNVLRKLMGNGLYGVDLKQVGRRCVVIEVNDNPNIDSGFEDKILGDELYRRIMRGFLRRVERKKEGAR